MPAKYKDYPQGIQQSGNLNRRKPVDCFTKKGEFIKRYDSISDVEADGYKRQTISKVINKKRKIAYNLIWELSDIQNEKIEKTERIKEHRFVYEKTHNVKLTSNQIVHHIDGNKFNNTESNLLVLQSQSEHAKLHYNKDLINSIPRLQTYNIKKRIPVACYSNDGLLIKVYPSMKSTEADGFLQGNVSKCILGKCKLHHGYKFMLWEGDASGYAN